MSRESGWRSVCPEPVKARQLMVLSGEFQIFLVRQKGPAAFTLKENGKRNPLQVRLGDPHSCSCRDYRQERDLCLHLCWTLLRKMQLKKEDPLSLQLGLVPQELDDMIRGTYTRPRVMHKESPLVPASVPMKVVSSEDLCPICLVPLLEVRKPVTYCRHGCGQPVHITCMKVAARYQVDGELHPDLTITCPLCRGEFCTWSELQKESNNAPRHHRRLPLLPPLVVTQPPPHEKETCVACLTSPVRGPLYRCLQCPLVRLCHSCITGRQGLGVTTLHADHGLVVKQVPLEPWRPARLTCLSKELIAELPIWRVRKGQNLLKRGQQCCLCLAPYQIRQEALSLPCGHQFHAACITKWLLRKCDSCPLDGVPVAPALRHKTLRKNCSMDPSKIVDLRQYKKHRKKMHQPPLEQHTVVTALLVKGLSLTDRRVKNRQQHQQSDKPFMSIEITPRNITSLRFRGCRVPPPPSPGSTLSVTSLSLPDDMTATPPIKRQLSGTAASRCWTSAYRHRTLSAREPPQLTCSGLKLQSRDKSLPHLTHK